MMTPQSTKQPFQTVEAHTLISQNGRADVTFGSGSGLQFSLKLTDQHDGTTRTAYLDDKRAPIESIRVQLSALKDHDAIVVEARRNHAQGVLRSDRWDLEVIRDGKVELMENVFATNMNFGACHVVAVDVVRQKSLGRVAAQKSGEGRAL